MKDISYTPLYSIKHCCKELLKLFTMWKQVAAHIANYIAIPDVQGHTSWHTCLKIVEEAGGE